MASPMPDHRPAEPTLHVHLDPLGGLAGDMFLAALLDARPELLDSVTQAIRQAGLPADWGLRLEPGRSAGLAGKRFLVEGPHDHGHSPSEPHAHAGWASIRAHLAEAPLAPAVRARAIAIFSLLAEAEARVHGIAVDAVYFHELAQWDSLADIVGAAAAIERLGPASWSVGVLPLGSGRVPTAHGLLPVPAPATEELLTGLITLDDGIPGERVTPTGAAILRHLAVQPLPRRPLRLMGSGSGLGSHDLPGLPNLLRLLLFAREGAADRPVERVAVITFEVDDQSAEDLAIGLEHLRRLEGVLDLLQAPVLGKKGRLVTQVQLLAVPDALEAVCAACLNETSSIGLRWQFAERAVLARRTRSSADGPVKEVRRPDGSVTAKLEADALAEVTGLGARQQARRRVEGEGG